MVDSASAEYEMRPSGSSRRLTAEEAEFLRRCLLDSAPVAMPAEPAGRTRFVPGEARLRRKPSRS